MNRHLIIFLVVTTAILCLGYAIFKIFILDENEDGLARSSNLSQDTEHLTENEPLQKGEDGSLQTVQNKMRVLATFGTVEKKSTSSSKWVPVATGDELFAKDAIKTDTNSRAHLAANDNSKIELRGESEINLDILSSTVHAINLKRGQLQVDYKKDKDRTVRVSTAKNGSVAESNSGTFVMQNHRGMVSLAATDGSATLTSNDETVTVAAGQYSTVRKGRSPGRVAPIPLEVMLRVAKPRLRVKNVKKIVLSGQADRGARVYANGIVAKVRPNGKFKATVPLAPGKNHINMVSRTPWGNVKKKLPVISVSMSGEVENAKVLWGQEKKKKEKRKRKRKRRTRKKKKTLEKQ